MSQADKYTVVVLSPNFFKKRWLEESEGVEWVYQVEAESSHWAEFRVREEWVNGILELVEMEEHIKEIHALKDTHPKEYEREINRIFSDAGYKALAFRDDTSETLE